MRARSLSFVALFVTVGVSCSRAFATVADKSMVSVELVCDDGGISSYSVKPYSATITDRTKHFTWTLTDSSNVVEAIIGPKGTQPWPFDDLYYTATPKNPAKSKAPKGGIPAGTYKYSISAVCMNGAKLDTISVDPDMIIPKGTM